MSAECQCPPPPADAAGNAQAARTAAAFQRRGQPPALPARSAPIMRAKRLLATQVARQVARQIERQVQRPVGRHIGCLWRLTCTSREAYSWLMMYGVPHLSATGGHRACPMPATYI